MPRIIQFPFEDRTVATEEELLAFVNKARAAGGANVLDALLPSVPENPEACLIARGLNFSCQVDGMAREIEDPACGEKVTEWGMYLPENMPLYQARTIAAALDCPLSALDNEGEDVPLDSNGVCQFVIALPLEIGNAAAAFDRQLAFKKFIKKGY